MFDGSVDTVDRGLGPHPRENVRIFKLKVWMEANTEYY